ncbi:hypothetical protein UCRNP2_2226 [Neofusicoccum parvum UCRNP2]|uniref:MARVEL domain-containing protein n=2 Tax=Neofusicoccum parvum TaxID=310453 RepID=R1GS05_BOTPV|nr:hypothetical protein UCRNP2_2226 [Neofusicoccum parvum UCRNP2]GME28874.1 hypothetical protein GTA08_BOTSDO12265 [Neofusicoccum parvum]
MLTALKLSRQAYSIYNDHKNHQRHKSTHRPNYTTQTPVSPNGGFTNPRDSYYNPTKRATMIAINNLSQYSHHGGLPGLLLRVFLRFFQFVLALTVCGLYGVDLNNARKAGAYADSKWVYAEVTAGFSAITCLVYFLPMIKSLFFFAWDWVLFILWVVLFGIFGRMYINEAPEYVGGITRMKNAVWVDLTNMLLWFITAVYGSVMWWMNRGGAGLPFRKSEV